MTYILTPAAGGTATTGNAAVSGSQTKGYTATITIPATFKGTVEIKATDNAGNEAVPMQIGASGSGIEGVLVESAPPTVTVMGPCWKVTRAKDWPLWLSTGRLLKP